MSTNNRILLIDSYDSFTLNLAALIRRVTGAEVVTIHNDSVAPDILISKYLPFFDAVVIGPGPGHPANPADAGVLPYMWKLSDVDSGLLPIFGVCLGFQSLVLAAGGDVVRLPEPKHGQVAMIEHDGNDIFTGIEGPFESVRYHSLHGKLLQADDCDNTIEPLAWTDDPHTTYKVLMAGKHTQKPFWGVQYHPESICSTHGDTVIKNFWEQAKEWSAANGRRTKSTDSGNDYQELNNLYSIKPQAFPKEINQVQNNFYDIAYTSLDLPSIPMDYAAVLIGEALHKNNQDFTLLNSAAFPGRWGVIGLLEDNETVCIKHYNEYFPEYVFLSKWNGSEQKIKLSDTKTGIWGFLSNYMAPKVQKYKDAINVDDNCENIPGKAPPGATFCGGLTGYLSYEAPQDLESYPSRATLEPIVKGDNRPYPDVNLVDIERMILLDSAEKRAYVLSLKERDGVKSPWFKETEELIRVALTQETLNIPDTCAAYFGPQETVSVQMPDKEKYINRILEAQEELRAGNSYELCMTGQTTITLPKAVHPWDLYKVLYKRNPAPYSCLMDLPGATLVGSSPERFMSWSARTGRCEFRPIKGTVKKSDSMTYEKASAILNTPKERGENLMIVDLIRHDLNALLDAVRVEKLMGVEEYKTVYQLVSVICGDLADKGDDSAYSGFDVLIHSLPPGSMTGAPKIRSVEILRDLEDRMPRGIYSGVSGYWSVLDEGDWSVVIRSAFQYKGEGENVWRIGAGGAITILSDPEDEWHEMSIKLESALQAFE
ncbi:uncharacterized protein SAPINGB_P002233 [Magnusiomyces paraingens]|uniref:aminodeoxychorismate synthase n=1 Tax=Magnusiomyces paraingens TaxID=2606893 RepID=A0A5E8BF43_9ASCO|nr:uncharacterized protein SAPINGB_P002233 [Saprochaete ingens]VVT49362.1 unnamed protein product [Saprochaete ingens]